VGQTLNNRPTQAKKRNRESSEEPDDDTDAESTVKKLRRQLQKAIPLEIPPEPPKPQSLRQKLLLLHTQATSASTHYQKNLNVAFAALSEMNKAQKKMEQTMEKLSILMEDPFLRQNDDWLTSRDTTPRLE
jgi:hypothetical protein